MFSSVGIYLRACHPPGRYGTKGLVIRRFTDGREPRGTDNEPSGNSKTQWSGATCLANRRSDTSVGMTGGTTDRVAAS